MTARMSKAEAQRLGLINRKPKTTRKAAARNGAVSRCTTCDETFTTDAAETRHVNTTRHPRYETTLPLLHNP